MVVAHDQDLRGHHLGCGPRVAVAVTHPLEGKSTRGMEVDGGGQVVLKAHVVVPPDDVDLGDRTAHGGDEVWQVPSLEAAEAGHPVL